MVRPAVVAGCQSLPVASRRDGDNAWMAIGPATRRPFPKTRVRALPSCQQRFLGGVSPRLPNSGSIEPLSRVVDGGTSRDEFTSIMGSPRVAARGLGIPEKPSPGVAEGDRSMFSASDLLAKHVFPPKDGPVPSRPVNDYTFSGYSIGHSSSHGSPQSGFTRSWRSLKGCLNQPIPGLVRSTMRAWFAGFG